jgi:hypothetical protein
MGGVPFVGRSLLFLCLLLLPGAASGSYLDASFLSSGMLDSSSLESAVFGQFPATPVGLDARQPPFGEGRGILPTKLPRLPLGLDRGTDQSTPPEGWFYHQLPYGSDALVHPARLILNGGFGILQFDNRDNRLGSVDFERGWSVVSTNLRHPVRAIESEGWWEFFQREVIPISVNAKRAQYWPNYTLHLIGGGMSYTMMREWYQAHGYRRPRVWAGATLGVYHMLNEVVENDTQRGPTTDPVADLYLFDPASILLFSHESVNAFFSRRLHLSDWSAQPALDPQRGTIENHGQHFSIKVGLPHVQYWSFFYYFGNHGEGGLSYRRENGSAYSVAVGMRARKLVDLDDDTRTTELAPSLGLFYDRNGSLLFSAQWANTSRYRLRVNAYPGLLSIGRFSPGLFLDANKHNEVLAGVTITAIPIGLSARVSR